MLARPLPSNFSLGFSFVELLVKLSLDLFILCIVLSVYAHSREGESYLQKLADLHQNMSIVRVYLNTDIFSAGFLGCRHLSDLTLNDLSFFPPTSPWLTQLGVIPAGQSLWGIYAQPGIAPQSERLRFDGDVLIVRRRSTWTIPVIASQEAAGELILGRNWPAPIQKPLLISNCQSAESFIPTRVASRSYGQVLNGSLHFSYREDAELAEWQEIAYFLAPTGRRDAFGEPIKAIYRLVNDQPAKALIEGVKSWEILYGVICAHQGTKRFIHASALSPACQIAEVIIHFEVKMPQQVLKEARSGITRRFSSLNSGDANHSDSFKWTIISRVGRV